MGWGGGGQHHAGGRGKRAPTLPRPKVRGDSGLRPLPGQPGPQPASRVIGSRGHCVPALCPAPKGRGQARHGRVREPLVPAQDPGAAKTNRPPPSLAVRCSQTGRQGPTLLVGGSGHRGTRGCSGAHGCRGTSVAPGVRAAPCSRAVWARGPRSRLQRLGTPAQLPNLPGPNLCLENGFPPRTGLVRKIAALIHEEPPGAGLST